MLTFLTRRLAAAVVILLILSLVIFVLQYVSPGDPARAYVGANASTATVAAERQRLGLNDPFFTQYFRFLGGLFTGDLGRSLRTRQPVTPTSPPTCRPPSNSSSRRSSSRWRLRRCTRCPVRCAGLARGSAGVHCCCWRRHRRSCWRWSASSSSSANSAGCRPAASETSRTLGRSACRRSTPCCTARRTRSSTRYGTWCCPRWCCPSHRRSPSAGCCGRRCWPCWTSTTCGRRGPRG